MNATTGLGILASSVSCFANGASDSSCVATLMTPAMAAAFAHIVDSTPCPVAPPPAEAIAAAMTAFGTLFGVAQLRYTVPTFAWSFCSAVSSGWNFCASPSWTLYFWALATTAGVRGVRSAKPGYLALYAATVAAVVDQRGHRVDHRGQQQERRGRPRS